VTTVWVDILQMRFDGNSRRLSPVGSDVPG